MENWRFRWKNRNLNYKKTLGFTMFHWWYDWDWIGPFTIWLGIFSKCNQPACEISCEVELLRPSNILCWFHTTKPWAWKVATTPVCSLVWKKTWCSVHTTFIKQESAQLLSGKYGVLENGPFISDFPMTIALHFGDFPAMFDAFPEGITHQIPLNHHFPMIFPWFSYGWTTIIIELLDLHRHEFQVSRPGGLL